MVTYILLLVEIINKELQVINWDVLLTQTIDKHTLSA